MTNYVYSGPVTGFTMRDGRDVMLFPGKTVALPEDHPFVKTLIAQKRLKVATAAPAAVPKAATPAKAATVPAPPAAAPAAAPQPTTKKES